MKKWFIRKLCQWFDLRPRTLQDHIKECQEHMERVSGVNSVVRGKPPQPENKE